MTTHLFRATAYRLQRIDTPPEDLQPEVTVFIEAADLAGANARLLRTLALVWGCAPEDVTIYGVLSEADLFGGGGFGSPEMGDAALLVNGWYHGPLFVRADRTLMLVRPLTILRLARARTLSVSWQARQHQAALQAVGVPRHEAVARASRVRETYEAIERAGG